MSNSRVEEFLEKAGFQVLTSDGEYFVDSHGKKYGAWASLGSVESRQRTEGGETVYEASRSVRQINPAQDTFLLLQENWQAWVGRNHYFSGIGFQGKCPCPTHYNAAVVTPLTTWTEGGTKKRLYSLLMLQSSTTRKQRFVKDLTLQEAEAKKRELCEAAY